MLDAGDRSVAIEASSHGAALRRLDRVRFDALVFTNLSQDHLDLHGSMEEYFQAKRRLFTGVEPPPAAVNVGDRVGRAARRRARSGAPRPARHVRVRARGRAAPRGSRAGRRREPVPGGRDRDRDAAARALQRRECARRRRRRRSCSGSTTRRSRRASRRCTGCRGASRRSTRARPFTVIVDYAHTPDSLDNVLQTARELADGRLIVVFGAGGDRDRGKRPLMGRVAQERADLAIVTSDNPRSEDPIAIIQDVLQGAGTDVEIDPDRRSAIARALTLAEAGDVVVIAGKGHEQGQEIAGVVHPFDDRAVVRELLRGARDGLGATRDPGRVGRDRGARARPAGTPGTTPGRSSGIRADSRTVGPGDLFVALNSGVEYVGEARSRGAATLVPDDQNAALAALASLVRSKSDAQRRRRRRLDRQDDDEGHPRALCAPPCPPSTRPRASTTRSACR